MLAYSGVSDPLPAPWEADAATSGLRFSLGQAVRPLSVDNPTETDMQNFFGSRAKTFAPDPEDFRRRTAIALQRRLMGGALTAKQVAHALGKHEDTVANWVHGRSTIDGAALEALDRFFSSIGDWQFIEEIYGELGVRRRKRAAQLEAQARRLREIAALLEPPAEVEVA